MGVALIQGLFGCLDNVPWGIEVRFTNFQVDDILAGRLQRPCFDQHFKRCLGA